MSAYRIVRRILKPIFRVLFRYEAPLARFDFPVIVVANHLSIIDPLPLAFAFESCLDFMAKSEIFRVPVFGPFVKACGVFPVVRGGGGRHALETAISRAKSGRTIAMFPEGTRSKDGELHAAKIGAAIIALGAGVPIVPVAIKGTYEVLPHGKLFPHFFRRITVKVGEAIDVLPYQGTPDGAARLTERYIETIKGMLSEDGRGITA